MIRPLPRAYTRVLGSRRQWNRRHSTTRLIVRRIERGLTKDGIRLRTARHKRRGCWYRLSRRPCARMRMRGMSLGEQRTVRGGDVNSSCFASWNKGRLILGSMVGGIICPLRNAALGCHVPPIALLRVIVFSHRQSTRTDNEYKGWATAVRADALYTTDTKASTSGVVSPAVVDKDVSKTEERV